MDLIEERHQCVVAFNWRHQREGLEAAAKKRGFPYAVIDGTVNDRMRREAVERFQAGELRAIFAHPQSAGHGLTLTAGTTTIWTSPTYNAEHYKQFNHRIYRSGQTKRTETIHIAARDTIDERVFAKLGDKLTSMQLLLDLMESAQ
jgi:SNF2 family DNA or RNA helicase